MRLLHTSDWHLGQTFHGYERHYEHQCFLEWLLDTLEHEQMDALLIAGDIFDNHNPSAAALHQFYRFIREAKTRLPLLDIVVVAGNHDSPFRLEAPSPLLTAMDVSVVGQISRDAESGITLDRLVVPVRNQEGDIRAWCLAVPFLRSSDLPRTNDADAASEGDAYHQGVAKLYHQAHARAESRRSADQAIIALGHCHLHGGEVSSDSERRIVIGGSEALPASIFPESLAYVGLGHLHRAQTVGGRETLRYSGSPLPLSFTEKAYPHQVVRIELAGREVSDISPLPVPRFVDLISPPEAALPEVLENLENLHLPWVEAERQPYLEVRVNLGQPEPGLRQQIETALKGKPVRLTRIAPRYPARPSHETTRPGEADMEKLAPEDIFLNLYQQRFASPPGDALRTAFQELLHQSEPEGSS